ncbi:MAG: twin-arginine translocase subunit TatC [Acidobacteria bacterium]|nr:twin-arginine translocase subunit TatC [Acidobacteriota bacterium]
MTVVDHLTELRHRIFVGLIAFGVAFVVAYALYNPILRFLEAPLDKGSRIGGVPVEGLNIPGVVTAFMVRIKISAFAAIVLALPVLLWQLWRFVTPALKAKEKRYAIPFVLSSLILFALGAYIAFAVLPAAIGFLIGFARAPGLKPLIFIDQYLSFVILMVLVFGLSFEFPVLLVFLAMAGIVGSARLRGWRRPALFIAFAAGAVLTPSGDPLSMILLAVPLYVLYELAMLIIRFGLKK